MRAIIAGGTGFIGRHLVWELAKHGWEIVVLSRAPGKVAEVFGSGVIGMQWDNNDWPGLIGPDTVIVNLAGENIASSMWTETKKQRILHSRVDAGRRIVEAVNQADSLPAALIQGSAVGFYGPRDTKLLDETTEQGSGFLADVCHQWEDSTKELEEMGVRRVVARTGLVLSGDGGMLRKMLPAFRFFLGGPLGDGFQGISWIHVTDEVRAIRFLMENEATSGVYNLTAPVPVRFRKFAHILGDALGRPYKLPVPASLLRFALRDMAEELLLSGQLILPKRLQEAGFKFHYEQLEQALDQILH